MKKVAFFAVVVVVFMGIMVTCYPAMAQQRGGGGGGRGFGGQAGATLSDALILNADKAEKVAAAYTEARQGAMQGADFQNMSQEERRDAFTKMQATIAAKLKEALKGVLSEKELAAVEPLLSRRGGGTVVELRALRDVELTDEQRAAIQPSAIELASSTLPNFRPQGGQEPSAEDQKKFDDAKAAFMAKANGVLKDEQKKAWQDKIAEVQKQQEEMRARRQNRGNQ